MTANFVQARKNLDAIVVKQRFFIAGRFHTTISQFSSGEKFDERHQEKCSFAVPVCIIMPAPAHNLIRHTISPFFIDGNLEVISACSTVELRERARALHSSGKCLCGHRARWDWKSQSTGGEQETSLKNSLSLRISSAVVGGHPSGRSS